VTTESVYTPIAQSAVLARGERSLRSLTARFARRSHSRGSRSLRSLRTTLAPNRATIVRSGVKQLSVATRAIWSR